MSSADIAKIPDPLARAQARLSNLGWQPRTSENDSLPPMPRDLRIRAQVAHATAQVTRDSR